MRSPFGIFRKHGTILTAGLVVLCMFAFTLADFLRPEHFPALLAMLAVGLIFYLIGQPSGKGGWYGLVGAVLGFVIVSFVPNRLWQPEPAASTALGDLSARDLDERIRDRREANQFMLRVYQTGAGPRPSAEDLFGRFPSLASNPQFLQMIMPQLMQQQQIWDRGFQNFGFAPLGESPLAEREATVRNWVMAQEAEDLGIRVSDAAVTEYLKKASNQQLTREQFTRFREELGISEGQLYDVLRFHIRARQYLLLTFPFAMTPPEQLWDYYRRATIRQDMELVPIPVAAFVDQVKAPADSELVAFFEQYKNRFPQGFVSRQEGWVEPVEVMAPEPAFGVPRKIKLAYFTAKTPGKEAYNPSETELKKYYEENVQKYPNPSFNRPLEDDSIPEPQTPDGPAVAQKPKSKEGPAWAEKREYLDYGQAQEDVRNDWIFGQQQAARLKLDERISKLLLQMNELNLAWQTEGEGHKTPQEISDELLKYAQELGFEKSSYTVPEDAWTAEEMTATKIGQAVEVDINPSPGPGEMKATVRSGGANVVYQVFENTASEDLFQPNQAISQNEVDTRYVYWKIEDHPPYVPEWNSLTKEQKADVVNAWKISKARDLAKARADEIRDAVLKYYSKLPKDAEDRDLQKALDELKLKPLSGENELRVQFAPSFQWMQPPTQQSGARLGRVLGVEKAGERFMETAFTGLDDDPKTKEPAIGVLVNADGTEYFVGRVLNRQYGQSTSLAGLREAYLRETPGTPAMQTVAYLESQQSQELFQKWLQQFDEKYEINVAAPKEN